MRTVSWQTHIRRELPVLIAAIVTALFTANDALDLIAGDRNLDKFAAVVAFLIFAAIVVRRILSLHTRLDEFESKVRVTARLGSLSGNVPDPGPDKISLRAHVFWEIWAAVDVSTERLALNMTYVYEKYWWQFWKKTSIPQMGIPPKGQDDTEYRHRFPSAAVQPSEDNAVFEYVAARTGAEDAHWLLHLILVTAIPPGVHRVPVFIDHDELRARGTYPPL